MNQQADVIIIGGRIHGAESGFSFDAVGVRPLILEQLFHGFRGNRPV
ncbi:MAG: hypothetical protein IPM76_27835 [Chloroflexi bacterium]|nr:hypothetical protein [Chloroflexota bacterium]